MLKTKTLKNGEAKGLELSIYMSYVFVEISVAAMVSDREASIPCENDAGWILGRMAVLHVWTTR